MRASICKARRQLYWKFYIIVKVYRCNRFDEIVSKGRTCTLPDWSTHMVAFSDSLSSVKVFDSLLEIGGSRIHCEGVAIIPFVDAEISSRDRGIAAAYPSIIESSI